MVGTQQGSAAGVASRFAAPVVAVMKRVIELYGDAHTVVDLSPTLSMEVTFEGWQPTLAATCTCALDVVICEH